MYDLTYERDIFYGLSPMFNVILEGHDYDRHQITTRHKATQVREVHSGQDYERAQIYKDLRLTRGCNSMA